MAGPGTKTFDPVTATMDIARDFVTTFNGAATLVARNGRIVAVSSVAAQMLEATPDSIAGRDVVELTVASDQASAREILRTATATGTPRNAELMLIAQGTRVATQVSVLPVVTSSGFVAGHIIVATPLESAGGDRRTFDRIVRSERAITSFGRSALHLTSVRSIERAAIDATTTALATPAVAVFRANNSQVRLQRTPESPPEWMALPAEKRSSKTLLAEAARNGQPIFVHDLAAEERYTPSDWLSGFRAAMVAVIRVNERVVGGIVTAHEQPGYFIREDLRSLEDIADIAGVALESLARNSSSPNSELQIGLAFELGGLGTWAWNPKTQRVWWSAEMQRLFGIEPGTFGGTLEEATAILNRGGAPRGQEWGTIDDPTHNGVLQLRFIDEQGLARCVELRGQPVNDRRDCDWIGVAFDATGPNRIHASALYAEAEARRARDDADRAEDAARAAGRRLRQAIDDAPVGFGFWDEDLRCLTMNDLLADAFGTTVPEAIGHTIAVFEEHQHAILARAFSTVLTIGEPLEHVVVTSQPRSDPTHRHTWVCKVFPTKLDHTITGVGAIVLDITEQKRSEHVERLLRSVTELFATPNVPAADLLRRSLGLALPHFADMCAIAFRDPDSGTVVGYGVGLGPADVALGPMTLTSAEAEQLFAHLRTNRTHARPARMADPVVDHALLDSYDLTSAIVITIIADGLPIGRLLFGYTSSSGRTYEHRDLQLGDEFAYRCSDILESSLLRNAAAQAQLRLEILARLGELTASTLIDSDDLRSIPGVFVPEFADATLLMVVESQNLHVAGGRGSDPEVDAWLQQEWRPAIPIDSDSPATRSIKSGLPELFNRSDMETHPERFATELRQVATHVGMEAALTVPIIGSSGPIGVLFCSRTAGRQPFDEGDLAIGPELARRIVPLIEAGQRLRQAQEHTEALQRSLLPQEIPQPFGYRLAARYRAAESGLRVGGDWYDALELADGSLLLVIGDVVGHGAFAAGLTGQLRTALRIAALDTTDVTLLLERLDRFLDGVDDLQLATALLVRLERTSGDLTWASAGHPPPLVRRAANNAEYLPTTPGPPLGSALGHDFARNHSILGPDECLVLYTDGLVERRHETIDDGLARLAHKIEAHHLTHDGLDTCVDRLVDEMLPDDQPRDDVAVLLVRRADDTATLDLPITNDPGHCREARHALSRFLVDANVVAARSESLTLIASELCANAMEHSGSDPTQPIRMQCSVSPRGAELSVEDHGTWVTRGPRHGGRGLQIVRALSDTVDVTRTGSGTRVTSLVKFDETSTESIEPAAP